MIYDRNLVPEPQQIITNPQRTRIFYFYVDSPSKGLGKEGFMVIQLPNGDTYKGMIFGNEYNGQG
jgi:hypothetical protein